MDWQARVAKIEEINIKIKFENPKTVEESERKYKQRLNRLFRLHCKTIPKCKKCKILLILETGTLCPNCERWNRDGFDYE